MARPRIIRLPDKGEVMLKNIDIVKAAAIQEYILSCYDAGQASTPAEAEAEVESSVEASNFDADMKHEGLSYFKDRKGNWHVVTLSYNPYTKEAEIKTMENVGDIKNAAINKFKVLCFEKGLI